jgi:hypothetical protein
VLKSPARYSITTLIADESFVGFQEIRIQKRRDAEVARNVGRARTNHDTRSRKELQMNDLKQNETELSNGDGEQSQHNKLREHLQETKQFRASPGIGIVMPIAETRRDITISWWTRRRHHRRGLHGRNASPDLFEGKSDSVL